MRKTFSIALVLGILAAVLTASCGGGGGGGTNASGSLISSEITIGPLTPQSIDLRLARNTSTTEAAARVDLTASLSGSTSGTVYVLIEDPDHIVTAGSALVSSSKSLATLTLVLSRRLPVGTYTSPVTLRACKDALCAVEFAGSPQTIQKNIVLDGITVSPSALNFVSSAGVAPPAQSLAVTPPAGRTYTYDTYPYVNFTFIAGNPGTVSIAEVFEISRTETGLLVQPKASFPVSSKSKDGKFVLPMVLRVPTYEGYGSETVNITYQIGAAVATTADNLTVKSDSLPTTGPLKSSVVIQW